MIAEQAAEPVYIVNDIVHQSPLIPQTVIGIGGAAPGLTPLVAAHMGTGCFIPEGVEVANAIGAAVARPTVDITFRADTAQGFYTVAELGIKEKLSVRHLSGQQAREMAASYLARRAEKVGIPSGDMSIVFEEEFNLIRGFSTIGKILTCRVQVRPGVLATFSDKGAAQ